MVQVNQCQVELAGTVYSAPPTHYYNNPYGQMVLNFCKWYQNLAETHHSSHQCAKLTVWK